MKRKYIVLVLTLLLILFVFGYFHVAGNELTPVASITPDYTCAVTKTEDTIDGPTTNYTLTVEQVLQLRDLILSSSFTRVPSNSYTYSGAHDRYSLVLELTDNQGLQKDYILMDYVEDLYFTVYAPYHDLYITLKIRNSHWHEDFESILSSY